MPKPRRLPRGLRRTQKIGLLRMQGAETGKPVTTLDCVLQTAMVRWAKGRDCEAVQRLSTQVVSNTRRKNSPMTTRHVACKVIVDACQEYEELACLATANFERK
jgi:hypothetical protein